jgi:hypothetical protein
VDILNCRLSIPRLDQRLVVIFRFPAHQIPAEFSAVLDGQILNLDIRVYVWCIWLVKECRRGFSRDRHPLALFDRQDALPSDNGYINQ